MASAVIKIIFNVYQDKANFSAIAKKIYESYIAFASGSLSVNGVKIHYPTGKTVKSFTPLSVDAQKFQFSAKSRALEVFEKGAPAIDMWNNWPRRGWLPMHRGARQFTGYAFLPNPFSRPRRTKANGQLEWMIPARKAERPAELIARAIVGASGSVTSS